MDGTSSTTILAYSSVIVNTEIWPDTMQYKGKTYKVNMERTLREFLNKGGKTGFVGSTDTHEGKPAAKTAVLAKELTRPAIFEALRHRRNYAVFNARIVLDFKINGHFMGEEIEIDGKPRIVAEVKGTDKIEEVVIVRDGAVIHTLNPGSQEVRLDFVDDVVSGKQLLLSASHPGRQGRARQPIPCLVEPDLGEEEVGATDVEGGRAGAAAGRPLL